MSPKVYETYEGSDYGKEVNLRIQAARERVHKLQEALYRAEEDLASLEEERQEGRKECGSCNDCSMCLG